MRHHPDELFAALQTEKGFYWSDADPIIFIPNGAGTAWISSLHMEASGQAFLCTLFHGHWSAEDQLATVRLMADGGCWYANSCTITGKPVPADPDAVLAMFVNARSQIRLAREPDFDRLLFDFTGLRLPIIGYR